MTKLKCVPIPEARRLAKEHGMKRLLILAVDGDGNFAFTTYGETKADCAAIARWADARAPWIAQEMAD